jgi:hypothetical protein
MATFFITVLVAAILWLIVTAFLRLEKQAAPAGVLDRATVPLACGVELPHRDVDFWQPEWGLCS